MEQVHDTFLYLPGEMQARKHCIFMDSKGLVCAARKAELQHHKLPFAHDLPFQKDLLSAVQQLHPTVLIGVSTIAGAFTAEVLAVCLLVLLILKRMNLI